MFRVGTPLYFSPEMWAGNPYDTRVDIWALGCVIHELAALKPPFSAATHTVLADRIMRTPATAIPAHFSIELQHLISQMLQKRAQARPYIDQVLSYPAVRVRVELREQRQQQVDLMSQIAEMQEETSELRTQVDYRYSRLGY